MEWKELDAELQQDGWNLQVNRHYDEWKALYVNVTAIPRSAKGSSFEEAVVAAANLVKEGK